MPRPTIDLTGKRFGKLIVLQRAGLDKGLNVLWKCQCDCGKTTIAAGTKLKSGVPKSCGCLIGERAVKILAKLNTVHGLSDTLTGWSWMTMLQRCYNPKAKAFENYGAKGIMACEFIRASPLNLVLLIGERPNRTLTLDRINNKMGYHCGQCGECLQHDWSLNVRWATRKEQARNRSNTVYATINGIRKPVSEWIELTGIPATSFRRRLAKGELHGIA